MTQRISARRTEDVQDSLDLLLRDRPIDEKNGVNASLGFTFQQWWAALSIAERLGGADDFAVGVEVKEDIAILDSALSPTKVEFCQVKKHEREGWAAAGFKDTLLRCQMKREVANGDEKKIQPGVQA